MAGILGSGHCIGMCGSLVSAFFLRMTDDMTGIWPYLSYHGARIMVYAWIGTAAGFVGLALTSTGIIGKAQGILQIVAGVIVILLGLDILGLRPFHLPFLNVPLGLFQNAFISAAEKGPVAGAAIGGILNGIMPCSLTLAMAVKATTAQVTWQGTLIMLAFGLGTLPSMLFVSGVVGRIGARVRGRLLKLAALFVIGLGISTLHQGVTFFNVMKNLPNW